MMRPTAFRLVAALAAAIGAGGCRGDGAAPVFRGAPIVLISIDTLRSDRLPDYGYRDVETPAISQLAREGILYQHAYSHTPLTLPSHASMLTGLLPGDHGVRDNLGYRLEAGRHPYLPRLLRDHGYRTGAAVSAYVLRAETGLAESFDYFDGDVDLRIGEGVGGSQRGCGETLALARPWLRQVARQPFFFLYHLYEPHTPYQPPADLRARYPNAYDGEVAAADRCVGELLAELRALEVYDRAVVVLVSDHGEGLGDHGEPEHGILLYREVLEVPLLLKLPGGARAGRRVESPAQLVDLFPTLAALAGLDLPAGLPGASLLELDRPGGPGRTIFAETYYPRLHMGWSELRSAIEWPHHLILGPAPELFDLAADPRERQNLLERERRVFGRLRERTEELTRPLQAPAAEDAETTSKLAALGYLGAATTAASGPLPDPKSRIHVLADYTRALHLLNEQRFVEAAAAFRRLADENPHMVDAWESLGQALQRLGHRDAALAAYRKAMELSGGSSHVALSTGTLLMEMGRLEEAAEHGELALAMSPIPARNLLAQVALQRGDLAAAERGIQTALETGGTRLAPLLTLAQVQIAQDRAAAALATTEEALRELAGRPGKQSFAGLHYVRGDALARLGRVGEAEAEFLREIEEFPADPKAYGRLAALYAAVDQPIAAREVIERLVQVNRAAPLAWAEAVQTLRVLGDAHGAAALLRQARQLFPDDPSLRELAG